MGQELVLTDDMIDLIASGDAGYDALARMTGQVGAVTSEFRPSFAKAGFQADDLYEVDGAQVEVPAKSLRIVDQEHKAVFLTDDIRMIILGRYFMFRRWSNDISNWESTSIIAPEFRNKQLPDDTGGFNAGRFDRWVSDEDKASMDPAAVALHDSARLFRVVFARVTGKGKTLTGKPIVIDDGVNVMFTFGTSMAKDIDNLVDAFNRHKALVFAYETKVTKITKAKAGMAVIGKPEFEQKFDTPVSLTPDSPVIAALREMSDNIKGHNQMVMDKHNQMLSGTKAQAEDEEEGFTG